MVRLNSLQNSATSWRPTFIPRASNNAATNRVPAETERDGLCSSDPSVMRVKAPSGCCKAIAQSLSKDPAQRLQCTVRMDVRSQTAASGAQIRGLASRVGPRDSKRDRLVHDPAGRARWRVPRSRPAESTARDSSQAHAKGERGFRLITGRPMRCTSKSGELWREERVRRRSNARC